MKIFTTKFLEQNDSPCFIQFICSKRVSPLLFCSFVLALMFCCTYVNVEAAHIDHHVFGNKKSNYNNMAWVLSGKVIDENGEILPGVTVRIVGTQKSVATDINGKFLIEINNEADSVAFSFVGYKTKTIRAGQERTVIIKLEVDKEGRKLNEIVVVGFGSQKKLDVTGAVSTVKVGDLQQSSTPSLSNTLGGRLPGIVTRQSSGEPGYDAANVYIRGFGTSGNRSPLILVDGVERDMNNLNIQEIESVTILKDASATAVYGIRGANGVLLITTKRGVEGKTRITFRTENAILTALRLPQYVNSYQYATLVNQATANVGKTPFYSDVQLQKYKDGSDPYLYPNVDWTNAVLKKNTLQTINNLSITGGNEKYKFFVNIGYTDIQGIYKEASNNPYATNTNVHRYNFRSNVDINLAKNLSMELNLGGIIQSSIYPGNSSGTIFQSLSLTPSLSYPLLNPDGSYPGSASNADLSENPFSKSTAHGYVTQLLNTLQSSFVPKWDLSSLVTKGLSVRGLFSSDFYSTMGNVRTKQPQTKQYLGKDANGIDQYKIVQNETALGYSSNFTGTRAIYTEASINYDRSFGKHSISGLLVANTRDYVNYAASTSIDNLPYRRIGYASRLTYNYDTRYLAEFNAGYNGSENFPKGRQYGFFPSGALGWYISNEPFWKIKAISSLKFRGSYGLVGNDQIGGRRFLFLTTINKTATNYPLGADQTYNSTGSFAEGTIGNNQVTWEVAKKANIGMDLEMFDGKIVLQVDAFRERRSGILLQRGQIPIVSGLPSNIIPYANLGIVNNKGFESSLTIQNKTKDGFYYSLTGNFTFTRNKIIEDDSPIMAYPYQNSRGNSLDRSYGYVALGLFKDQNDINNSPSQTALASVIHPGDIKYKDLNGDGKITSDDRTYIGYARTPEIMFGFGGTIAWKGFDASIFFTGAAHSNIILSGFAVTPFSSALNNYNVWTDYFNNRWIPGADNSKAKYPSVVDGNNTNNYTTNTLYMRDGSYIRLKSAEIGYNISKGFIKRIGMSDARIFINGINLALWDKVKVIDPESDNGSGGYPLQRSANLGLQVKF